MSLLFLQCQGQEFDDVHIDGCGSLSSPLRQIPAHLAWGISGYHRPVPGEHCEMEQCGSCGLSDFTVVEVA